MHSESSSYLTLERHSGQCEGTDMAGLVRGLTIVLVDKFQEEILWEWKCCVARCLVCPASNHIMGPSKTSGHCSIRSITKVDAKPCYIFATGSNL